VCNMMTDTPQDFENLPFTSTVADANAGTNNDRESGSISKYIRMITPKFGTWFTRTNDVTLGKVEDVSGGEDAEASTASSVRYGIAVFKHDGKFHILASILRLIINVIESVSHLGTVTSKGRMRFVREVVSTFVVVILVAFLLHQHAKNKLDFMKAEKEEMESCHVCMDTSKTPEAPCTPVTEIDFTTHVKKMGMLVTMMKDHINHDGDACMSSFHIGSRACAVAVKGSFSTYVYFNPIETRSEWDTPPSKYVEGSDFFSGKELVRERPRSLTLKYIVLADGKMTNESIVLVGSEAVCMCHILEVMNGTHTALYSAISKVS
jgi:hypothetical protein